ncbi:MAG: hypothetical protein ACTSRP_12475 [Candidatus Helarchaeota archaeon]
MAMLSEDCVILTFEEWSKEFKSFIKAQVRSFKLETDVEEKKKIQRDIRYNAMILIKGKELKDEAIFYRDGHVLSYALVGKEFKKKFDAKEKKCGDAYV